MGSKMMQVMCCFWLSSAASAGSCLRLTDLSFECVLQMVWYVLHCLFSQRFLLSCKDVRAITFTNCALPELSALYLIKHHCAGALSLFSVSSKLSVWPLCLTTGTRYHVVYGTHNTKWSEQPLTIKCFQTEMWKYRRSFWIKLNRIPFFFLLFFFPCSSWARSWPELWTRAKRPPMTWYTLRTWG